MIDSLHLGGAERVAVNLSNALSEEGIETHLCVTREDGPLRDFISPNVHLLFLHKKGKINIGAFIRLVRYVKHHHINIIHAHSSSIYMAVLVKSFCKVKVIWHDHYGTNLMKRSDRRLRLFTRYVNFEYAVNYELKKWSMYKLNIGNSNIEYLSNFPVLDFSNSTLHKALPGNERIKIVNTANLRPQKDHITLIKAIQKIKECDLYIIGNDVKDDYSMSIHQYINDNKINNVHILGGRTDVAAILNCCDIGVLSSESEGLPVSLLEYGLAGLPVVCTNVGECATVLGNGEFGLLVEPHDSEHLAGSLQLLIDNPALRTEYGTKFHKHILQNYSQKSIIKKVIQKYIELLS